MYCTYKYNMEMPPATVPTEQLMPNHLTKHMNEILDGKSSIMISPVFRDGFNNSGHAYYQLMFDMDFKHVGKERGAKTANNILIMLQNAKLPYFLEASEDGVHILTRQCYLIDKHFGIIKKKYKNFFDKNFPGFDYESSFRNIPTYRSGGMRGNFTIIPCPTVAECLNKKIGVPRNYFNVVELMEMWEKFLIPMSSYRTLSNVLESIFGKIDKD